MFDVFDEIMISVIVIDVEGCVGIILVMLDEVILMVDIVGDFDFCFGEIIMFSVLDNFSSYVWLMGGMSN